MKTLLIFTVVFATLSFNVNAQEEISAAEASALLGEAGSGYQKGKKGEKAVILHLSLVKHPELGEIYLPNVPQKRGIAVPQKTSVLPECEFRCKVPEGGLKLIVLDRKDPYGNYLCAFVRKGG